MLDVIAARYGKRPSELLRGNLRDLVLDALVAAIALREESRIVRRLKRREA